MDQRRICDAGAARPGRRFDERAIARTFGNLELKVNFIRALTSTVGPVRAEGKDVTVGGQIGIAEGRLTDANGKLYAFATTTCLIFTIP